MTRQQLIEQIIQKRSFLCVGLDPDPAKMPACVMRSSNPIYDFNRAIIDATAEYAVAYKPNLAFYEAVGLSGMEALKLTCSYLRENYPDIFVIADAKRGDIGNTARMYAKALFIDLDADAATVAPYMGKDSVSPFMEYEHKWTILLALTSNPGSADFQRLPLQGGEVWQEVIKKSSEWGSPENLMYVVGATRSEMIQTVRSIAPSNFLLVPGVGAQGGNLSDVCRYGLIDGCGLIVNASRSILYASGGDNYANAAAKEAKELRDAMDIELIKKGM